MDLTNPTASPVDFRLGGKDFRAYPFRDVEHGELNLWVRKQYVKSIMEVVGKDPAQLRTLQASIPEIEWHTEPGSSVTFTPEGLVKIAQLLVRNSKNKPTKADITTAEDVESLMDAFGEVHGWELEGVDTLKDGVEEAKKEPVKN